MGKDTTTLGERWEPGREKLYYKTVESSEWDRFIDVKAVSGEIAVVYGRDVQREWGRGGRPLLDTDVRNFSQSLFGIVRTFANAFDSILVRRRDS